MVHVLELVDQDRVEAGLRRFANLGLTQERIRAEDQVTEVTREEPEAEYAVSETPVQKSGADGPQTNDGPEAPPMGDGAKA